jgi:hypothetical protein
MPFKAEKSAKAKNLIEETGLSIAASAVGQVGAQKKTEVYDRQHVVIDGSPTKIFFTAGYWRIVVWYIIHSRELWEFRVLRKGPSNEKYSEFRSGLSSGNSSK